MTAGLRHGGNRGGSARQLLLVAALGAMLCPLLLGCGHHGGADDEDDNSAPSANAVAEVTLTRVQRATISQMLTLTGTAAALPNQDVRVSSLVAGRIAELHAAEGDRVRAGELLAKIDDHTYQNQLLQAEAAEAQAQAALDNAKLSLARNQSLFHRGIAARKDLEDAQMQVSTATAGLQAGQASLALAKLNLARTQIKSPLDGIVVKRFASVGEQVDGTAAEPIAEVVNLREVEFLANAPAGYLFHLRPGEPVDVKTEAVPGQAFRGRIVAISPAVDPATGVGTVRLRVPNPAGMLRIGIFLSAQLPIETHANALVAPLEAIYRDASGEPEIYAVSQDTATAVTVKIGIETNGQAELLSGARQGEIIVGTGGYGLPHEAKVRVVAAAQAEAPARPGAAGKR